MDSVTAFSVYFHLFAIVNGLTSTFVYELYSENEINGNIIFSFVTNSVQACVALCDDTYGCLSVNFHKDDGKCLLTDYYPTDNTRTGVTEDGWKIYFRRHFGVDLLKGATAWQSSTYTTTGAVLYAENAIDGKTAQDILSIKSCAHTSNGYSYWAVEFGTSGPVKEVEIYLRSDGFFQRNSNFTVTVSNSRDDVINDGGTLCGAYFGPNIDTAPFRLTITCANTVYGKFLKVKHGMDDYMTLCEVFVYTP